MVSEKTTTAHNHNIARAAMVVMAAFILSRALGLVREMVIGAQFGTSAQLDAYLAAFRVPDLIFQLIAGGALGSAFIPTFSSYLVSEDRVAAWRMASAVINLFALIVTAISIIAVIFAPQIAPLIVPGFDAAGRALTTRLMRIMLIGPPIFCVSGLVMGILNVHQHFLLPALAPSFYNLGIIGGALLLTPRYGVYGLAMGVICGAILHLLVQLPGLWCYGARYFPVLYWHHAGVREVARLMGPRVLGLAMIQLNFWVNTILASGLSAGSLSAFNFAWLLMLLPLGVFPMAISTAAFPTFAELAAREARTELRRVCAETLRVIIYLTVPAAAGLIVLRVPLVRVLFERGEFDAASTAATVWALQFFALGLAAHSTVEILTRAFYALHDTMTPVFISVGAMLLNVVLSLLLMRPLTHGGLALANALAANVEAVALVLILRQRMGGIEGHKLWGSAWRVLAGAGVMSAVVIIALRFSGEYAWLQMLAGAVTGSISYLAITILLGATEWRVLLPWWQE